MQAKPTHVHAHFLFLTNTDLQVSNFYCKVTSTQGLECERAGEREPDQTFQVGTTEITTFVLISSEHWRASTESRMLNAQLGHHELTCQRFEFKETRRTSTCHIRREKRRGERLWKVYNEEVSPVTFYFCSLMETGMRTWKKYTTFLIQWVFTAVWFETAHWYRMGRPGVNCIPVVGGHLHKSFRFPQNRCTIARNGFACILSFDSENANKSSKFKISKTIATLGNVDTRRTSNLHGPCELTQQEMNSCARCSSCNKLFLQR